MAAADVPASSIAASRATVRHELNVVMIVSPY